LGATSPSGPGPPHSRSFFVTHDNPQSAGLLWTSDQPVAETVNLYSLSNKWINMHGALVEWHWEENQSTRRKTYPSARYSTTNPELLDLGLNKDFHGKRSTTNLPNNTELPAVLCGCMACYSIVLCLTTLAVGLRMWRLMIQWKVVVNETGCGRKWSWTNLRDCLRICVGGLRETKNHIDVNNLVFLPRFETVISQIQVRRREENSSDFNIKI